MEDSRPSSVALLGEALNHPLLRYRALLRGRGLFEARILCVWLARKDFEPSIS
jgi:hypothetical protein